MNANEKFELMAKTFEGIYGYLPAGKDCGYYPPDPQRVLSDLTSTFVENQHLKDLLSKALGSVEAEIDDLRDVQEIRQTEIGEIDELSELRKEISAVLEKAKQGGQE